MYTITVDGDTYYADFANAIISKLLCQGTYVPGASKEFKDLNFPKDKVFAASHCCPLNLSVKLSETEVKCLKPM